MQIRINKKEGKKNLYKLWLYLQLFSYLQSHSLDWQSSTNTNCYLKVHGNYITYPFKQFTVLNTKQLYPAQNQAKILQSPYTAILSFSFEKQTHYVL